MRKKEDPPFDAEYVYSTYILERAAEQGALVVNHRPQEGLRDMNEKVYTAWFPQCCAPTLITRDIWAKWAPSLRTEEHERIVCKPSTAYTPGDVPFLCWSATTKTSMSCSRRSHTIWSARFAR